MLLLLCVCVLYLVCSWVSCDFAPQSHRSFVLCVTHTQLSVVSGFRSTRATRAGNFQNFPTDDLHHDLLLSVFILYAHHSLSLLLLFTIMLLQVCLDYKSKTTGFVSTKKLLSHYNLIHFTKNCTCLCFENKSCKKIRIKRTKSTRKQKNNYWYESKE